MRQRWRRQVTPPPPPPPLRLTSLIYQQLIPPSTNLHRLKNSHNFVRPYVFIKMNNQEEKAPPPSSLAPGAGSGGSFTADRSSHQYPDDQRPMSKQKEALASADLKRSHFSAAPINWSARYLFPLLVINAGRDIILIISGPISSIACLCLISISFVFHTVILIQWDIKHLNGAEMQRSGVSLFSSLLSVIASL